jgi:uncharacterized protein YcfJ
MGTELPHIDDARVFDNVTTYPDELSMEPITLKVRKDVLEEQLGVSPKAPKRRRSWLGLAALALVATGVVAFVVFGGVGALMVAGGAAAGLFLMAAPVADPQLQAPPSAASQGKSDANLVVMPDPGVRAPTPHLP